MYKTYLTDKEMYDKSNEARMLEGNIARLCVTDTEEEAYQQYYWITKRAAALLNITLLRIERKNKDTEYSTEEKK